MKWLSIKNGCRTGEKLMSKKKLTVKSLWMNGNIKYCSSQCWCHDAMVLTSDTRLTRIRGASVPGWILLQHSVGHQTTWHQCRGSVTFNPFEASSYPLFPAKTKASSKIGGFIFSNMNIRTELVLFFLKYLFIPKSCLTASSNTFFNSETENQTTDFDI